MNTIPVASFVVYAAVLCTVFCVVSIAVLRELRKVRNEARCTNQLVVLLLMGHTRSQDVPKAPTVAESKMEPAAPPGPGPLG